MGNINYKEIHRLTRQKVISDYYVDTMYTLSNKVDKVYKKFEDFRRGIPLSPLFHPSQECFISEHRSIVEHLIAALVDKNYRSWRQNFTASCTLKAKDFPNFVERAFNQLTSQKAKI